MYLKIKEILLHLHPMEGPMVDPTIQMKRIKEVKRNLNFLLYKRIDILKRLKSIKRIKEIHPLFFNHIHIHPIHIQIQRKIQIQNTMEDINNLNPLQSHLEDDLI